jgi:hypothetical protein
MAKFENEKLPGSNAMQPAGCVILMRCHQVWPSASPMAAPAEHPPRRQRFDSISAALEILG